MRIRLTFLVLFLLPAPAWSILIESGKQRVGGYLVSEDAKQTTVRTKTPEGKEKEEVYDRAKIKIIHQVDRKRLEKLSKDNPKAYRDYANVLAKEKTDPEAVEVALRLYLIAAHLDSPNLGRSCLLSMSDLATRPADARKYRAMAFLLDAKSDAALLKADPIPIKAGPPTPETKAAAKALTDFQKALKSYRNGQIKTAKDYANEKGVADFFGKTGMDMKSFLQACNDITCTKCKAGYVTCSACNGKGKIMDPFGMGFQLCTTCNGKGKQKCSSCDGSGLNPYPEDQLKAVLRAEIWALDQVLAGQPSSAKKSSGGWSDAPLSTQAAAPNLTLETITEFDPRQSVYRNGKWAAP